jgi:hypothetical protein
LLHCSALLLTPEYRYNINAQLEQCTAGDLEALISRLSFLLAEADVKYINNCFHYSNLFNYSNYSNLFTDTKSANQGLRAGAG